MYDTIIVTPSGRQSGFENSNYKAKVWIDGWFPISEDEYDTIKNINKRIAIENEKIASTSEYQKNQRRLEYERLKEEFEAE
jgi:hypothetical protein